MKTESLAAPAPHAPALAALTGARRRTLDALFRHPCAHNLEWTDVVSLIEKLGDMTEKPNSEFVLNVSGRRLLMRKPHGKALSSAEVLEIRHFLTEAGMHAHGPAQPASHPSPAAPNLLLVVDHHGTRIFHLDVSAADSEAHVIKPYDPHHFLHHLVHHDQSRERGQRAPEEPAYYEAIAAAVAGGGGLVVVGHGTGKSNAAHHLTAYLRDHHSAIFARVVRELTADLSSITPPQLLDLARDALSAG